MQIKIFGKELFGFNKGNQLFGLATTNNKESKFLIDFYQMRESNPFESYIAITEVASEVQEKKEIKEEQKLKLTPKDVHKLQMLNEASFRLNINEEYIEKQLQSFKDKLELIKSEEYDMSRGVNEISSVISRLENRKKYNSVKGFFDEFPYTTTSKINSLIKEHDYLKLGQVAQFVADMPKEAIKVMKDYNESTKKLCGKQAVFYIIADKKDFEKSNQRRDPILLAQSPFGHFWQILGAWDKEMMFLEEL